MTGAGTAADLDAMRPALHGVWASVADAWAERAESVDERAAETTAAMLGRASLSPGDRVLELACGPGGLGLAAAAVVGPDGEVVLSDVVPAMVETAARRAGERGVTNVRTRVLDLEQIDEPDAGYDAVLCREGLMFAADPVAAAREVARVLRPGGRFVAAVWGPRTDNPWLGFVLDVVGEHLGTTLPPPGIPGPFALSDVDHLSEVLREGGLVDVTVDDVSVPMRAASVDAWWSWTSSLAGPMAAIIASLPPETDAELRQRLAERTVSFAGSHGLELPGVSLLATARRSAGG
jgi:SAM-dependent methyltransferase